MGWTDPDLLSLLGSQWARRAPGEGRVGGKGLGLLEGKAVGVG